MKKVDFVRRLLVIISLLVCCCVRADPLQVGLLSYDPPFVLPADQANHFFGFDSDLISEICNRMQVSCNFVPLTIEPLFAKTLNGSLDLAMGSINITTDRMKIFLFSLPYLVSKGQYVVNTSSTIKTLADIRDKRVGTQLGSLFKGLVMEQFNSHVQVIEYLTQPLMFQALDSGKVDAIFLDKDTAVYWMANNNGLVRLVGDSIPIGLGYGIISNKSNGDLIAKVNAALLSMQNDGTYLKIYSRYFNPDTI